MKVEITKRKSKSISEHLKKYRDEMIRRPRKCNQRAQTDGFAEQNGRDAERADLTVDIEICGDLIMIKAIGKWYESFKEDALC